ncbi:MAG: AMP-binding protein [Micromonosporaceae bacterium]
MTPVHTVPDLLRVRAAQQPDRDAFLTPDGRSLTFRDWQHRSGALAAALLHRGVRRGDRIGLRYRNADWPEYAVAYLAVQRAGAVAVPLSARMPGAQLGYALRHCAASALLHTADGPPVVDDWHGWTATADDLHCSGGVPLGPAPPGGPVDTAPGGLVDIAPGDLVDPVPGPGDLAQILYTSGTTGTPKGVAASHANLLAGYRPDARQRPLAHSRHFLHAFPIGHNIGQTMLMNALTAAPTALLAGDFDAERCCALIERHRVGTVFVVPTMAIDLLASGVPRRYDLSSVVLLGATGAALPPAVAVGLTEVFGNATVVNYYTSTEAAPTQTTMVFDPDRPASVGRATHGDDVLVGDPESGPLPAGVPGDVWLRSAPAPRSYYGDAEASAAVFRDGWTRMGDVGYLDADGYLHLVDRESDVVKSGGFKVSTLQVEAALYEHPAVTEAAAVGVPHPSLGTTVAAAVVLGAPTPTEQLRAFLADRLARHECPTRILVLDQLPRNEVGKVVKRALAERLATPEPSPAPVTGTGAAVTGTGAAVTGTSAARAASATETALASLWAEMFGATGTDAGLGTAGTDTAGTDVGFGPSDDFFALGGDSLNAVRLAARIAAEFGVEVPPTFPFDFPLLAAQAEAIDALGGFDGQGVHRRAPAPTGQQAPEPQRGGR